jgi:uncharacterized protein
MKNIRPIFRRLGTILLGLGALLGTVALDHTLNPAVASGVMQPVVAQITATGLQTQTLYPPRQDTVINDYADLLQPADKTKIRQTLEQLKATHGIEAVVVTVPSIGMYETGDPHIEAFATNLFNNWGIGDASRNDGVLVVMSVGDRAVRIELGKGYSRPYDRRMQAIIDDYMLPRFRAEDYSGGLDRGSQALATQLTAPPTRVETLTSAEYWPAARTGGIFAVASGGLVALCMGLKRFLSPRCRTCNITKRILPKSEWHKYLNEGQTQEVKLLSAFYAVFQCPQCRDIQHVALPGPYQKRYNHCPSCQHRTVGVIRRCTTVEPTYSSSGKALVTWGCHHCTHREEVEQRLPRLRDSHDDDSSSGGGSSGGGSSSGGGASGRW